MSPYTDGHMRFLPLIFLTGLLLSPGLLDGATPRPRRARAPKKSAATARPKPRPTPAPVVKDESTLREEARQRRRRSDEVYLQALRLSQKGDEGGARHLCQEALALDPDNIQAQRMLERLLKQRR